MQKFSPRGEPALDAASLFSEVQREIADQHRQLAALDLELGSLQTSVGTAAAAEAELQKVKNTALLAFMQVHALVVERERRTADDAAETTGLLAHLGELLNDSVEYTAAGARQDQLARQAAQARSDYVEATVRVKRQWETVAALLQAASAEEVRRIQGLDGARAAAQRATADAAKRASAAAAKVTLAAAAPRPPPRPAQPPRSAQPPRPAQPSARPAQPSARPAQPSARPAQPSARPAQPTSPALNLRALVASCLLAKGRADAAMVHVHCSAISNGFDMLQIVNTLDAMRADFEIYVDGTHGYRLM